ncbi:hypothetical protein [Paenibacillus sp. TY11]|uniref:hypothetical protein n=1 Tax=Paenibacillus sp. TY11 TaxID=3448633 RepID=UPI004039FBA7
MTVLFLVGQTLGALAWNYEAMILRVSLQGMMIANVVSVPATTVIEKSLWLARKHVAGL